MKDIAAPPSPLGDVGRHARGSLLHRQSTESAGLDYPEWKRGDIHIRRGVRWVRERRRDL